VLRLIDTLAQVNPNLGTRSRSSVFGLCPRFG